MPDVDTDLRVHPPRRSREMAGGLAFLPRTIDKVRAKLAGTLGPYKVSPGLSADFFEWLGVTEASFTEVVARAPDDEPVIAWLRERCDAARFDEINERLRARGIRDEAHRLTMLPTYPVLRKHPDVTSWFDISDLDDAWMFEEAARFGGMQARFVTFSSASHSMRPGVLIADRVRPFPATVASLAAFIALDESSRTEAIADCGEPVALDDATLHAPLHPAKNVFCVGRNYLAHVEEGARARGVAVDVPARPTYFTKAPTSIADPGADLHLPPVSLEYDWEAELAAVVGRRCRDVSESDALEVIFGYMCLNDLTARDLQKGRQQWFKGKSLDSSCPLGPWIVPAIAIGDPQALDISLTVNGIVKQDGSTRSMIFSVVQIVSDLSSGLTLEPGDVIATGTPDGVGFARTPPEFLHDGDVVEVRIEKIGVLRNRIRLRSTSDAELAPV